MTKLNLVAMLLCLITAACSAPVDTEMSAELSNRDFPVTEGMIQTGDGLRLYYRTVGDGPDHVVIPADLFLGEYFDALAEGRTLIFYDMRNRGRSDSVKDDSQIGIAQDVRDLEAVRRHFGLKKMKLIGWSYLGLMVVLYAFDHPEHVERIVQIGPVAPRNNPPYASDLPVDDPPLLDPQEEARLTQIMSKGEHLKDSRTFYDQYWKALKPMLFGDQSKLDLYRLPPNDLENEWVHHMIHHFQVQFSAMGEFDYREKAHGLTLPVLTVHGTKDRNAIFAGGVEWSKSFTDSRLLTVQGAAHLPFIEQPDLVFGAIDAFLKGEWPAKAEVIR